MTTDKITPKRAHNVIMEGRKTLSVSGVADVGSFDEHMVVIFTDMGELTVKGTGLHIDKLSVETGDIALSGQIIGMMYTDEREKSGGFFGRIFR